MRVRFAYDYVSRRVEKNYEILNASSQWVTQTGYPQRFIYDQWNVVMVLDGNDSNDIDRKYTWGLDLSGLQSRDRQGAVSGIHGAGGIGGLLSAWDDTSGSARLYWYFYDGNGNVVQVLEYDDSSDTLNTTPVAHYEYDPYGQLITSTGGYKDDNPFRFSTKWLDDELAAASQTGAIGEEGLYYYGYRHYSPSLGRWINRDPIGEEGGLNLHCFVRNFPLGAVDAFGKQTMDDAVCYWLLENSRPSRVPSVPPRYAPPPQQTECWLTRVCLAGICTYEWACGIGSEDRYCGSNHCMTTDMRRGAGGRALKKYFEQKNKDAKCCKDLQGVTNFSHKWDKWHFWRPIFAGINPTQHFVGSLSGEAKVLGCRDGKCMVQFTLTNPTSLESGTYGIGPEYPRSKCRIGGTVRQTYTWIEEFRGVGCP